MESCYVHIVANYLKVHPARIFGLSSEYSESHHSKSSLQNAYYNWLYHDITPPFVEDFILDFLAGRIDRKELVL